MQELSPRKVAQVILMHHELSRAEDELREFIDAMTEDEQVELVAVMWIGRASFERPIHPALGEVPGNYRSRH